MRAIGAPIPLTICATEWTTRGARCAEIIREALTGEFFEHHGKHYDVPKLSINPVPSKPMPIIVGGTATAVLKRAARIADGFVSPNTTADEIAKMVKAIHGYRKEYGTEGKPFQMISVAIDAFDLDGPSGSGRWGSTSAVTCPGSITGASSTRRLA